MEMPRACSSLSDPVQPVSAGTRDVLPWRLAGGSMILATARAAARPRCLRIGDFSGIENRAVAGKDRAAAGSAASARNSHTSA